MGGAINWSMLFYRSFYVRYSPVLLANDCRALSSLALHTLWSPFVSPIFTIEFIDVICRQRNVGSLSLQKGDEEE